MSPGHHDQHKCNNAIYGSSHIQMLYLNTRDFCEGQDLYRNEMSNKEDFDSVFVEWIGFQEVEEKELIDNNSGIRD